MLASLPLHVSAAMCPVLTLPPDRPAPRTPASPLPPRSGYVIVAWIWAGIWYMLLDPIKWALAWFLNEDGFRDRGLWKKQTKRAPVAEDKGAATATGVAAPTHANPLGRASLSKAPADVLDKKSASVVAVTRDPKTGMTRASTDPSKNLQIARNSMKSAQQK